MIINATEQSIDQSRTTRNIIEYKAYDQIGYDKAGRKFIKG